jgi:hypothetical protein
VLPEVFQDEATLAAGRDRQAATFPMEKNYVYRAC